MIAAINSRRSCRKFDSTKPIPHEILQKIVDLAISSPTGVDAQSNDLYVVTKKEVNNKISEKAISNLPESFKGMGLKLSDIFYGAPAVIYIIAARKEREDCAPYDLGIIFQNICVAAKYYGLDSTVIGFAQCCPPKDAKEILGLNEEAPLIGVALGYADKDWKPSEKELKSKVQWIE